ncbi:ATP-dependent DNA helicase [Rubrivivax rivuli]|uniref:ATP-dependent DNA helicase n=1 Tax=Rubrivivax rivuli TaxID=1862385 RepID=UPI001FE021F7|nr:ATP-dependent DNA helicase [Rubrivivax rivuli]
MEETPAPAWRYTVSVRELCEFTAKHGDLDRRFTPSATALEGLQGQQAVASRRGADYETEIALQAEEGGLRVRGRADGYDPRRRTLEEVKTLRGRHEDIPDNRRLLHWAQLQTYGALFCRTRAVEEVALALVYFDTLTQTETELRQVFGAAELEALFKQRCAAFAAWAEQEALHRQARDAALATLSFPPGRWRPGQRLLAEAVYRHTVRGQALLAQAPTGIGKTIGTLFPLLRAVPGQGVDKLAFLTCKGTGRLTALEALGSVRETMPAQPLRVLSLVAKEQACEHPDKACHGQACPLALGFYDRLPAARAEAVAEGWLDATAQRRIALRHGLCPYYLGQELLRWADVLVGDVHHLFDPNGHAWGLAQALGWKLAVLVDEAHNLVERTRAMYSAELPLALLQDTAATAPAALRAPLRRLAAAAREWLASASTPYEVCKEPPDDYVQALQQASGALADHFQQLPLATGPLLNFHFELQRHARLLETLGPHTLLALQTDPDTAHDGQGGRAAIVLHNVAPAPFLRPRFAALHSAVLFSATIAPPAYAQRLLGLPENTGWLDVPPAFPPEHLQVRVAAGLSTRYADRPASLQRLVGVLARQFDAHPGNYLAFFSSFDYLAQAAERLAALRPDIPQWRQDRRMGPAAREGFLARFQPQGQGIGFAVLGGVFAEGVDLPGPLLIGAFIATLALPPVSPQQDAMQERLQQLLGADDDAEPLGPPELVPAMQKVVQAAGRVLRTPEDRGWLWLLDERYTRPEVVALLPPWWGLGPAAENASADSKTFLAAAAAASE